MKKRELAAKEEQLKTSCSGENIKLNDVTEKLQQSEENLQKLQVSKKKLVKNGSMSNGQLQLF